MGADNILFWWILREVHGICQSYAESFEVLLDSTQDFLPANYILHSSRACPCRRSHYVPTWPIRAPIFVDKTDDSFSLVLGVLSWHTKVVSSASEPLLFNFWVASIWWGNYVTVASADLEVINSF